MTKEELIEHAWGKYPLELEENGWLYFGYVCNGWDDIEDWLNNFGAISDRRYYDMTFSECDNGDLVNVKIRPKSLQGIEDNNGWVKVESEEDLPKENIDCFYITKYSKDVIVGCFRLKSYKGWKNMFTVDHNIAVGLGHVTHYQTIEKPKLPIY